MRFTLHPTLRSLLSTAVAVTLGLSIVGVSTAAQAAQSQTEVEPTAISLGAADAASRQFEGTIAPYVSAEAEAMSTEPLDEIVEDAETALDQAEDAVAAADAAEQKVTASKLDVRGADTVDTSALEEHIDQLETIATTPVLLLPATTGDAASDTAKVKKATA